MRKRHPVATSMATIAALLGGAMALAREVDSPSADGVLEASYRLGQERLEVFAATVPRLAEEDVDAVRTYGAACMHFDGACLEFLREQPAVARRALPDNAEFWDRYRSLLEVSPLSRQVEEVEGYRGQKIVQAANGWFKVQWLTHGALEADDVHFHLMSHRRLLGQAHYLIDKLIFTATTGLTLQPLNVLMAEAGGESSARHEQLLDDMLRPLTLEELSLRRVVEGEERYARVRVEQYGREPDAAGMEHLRRVYDALSKTSELSWRAFWQDGIEVTATPLDPDFPTTVWLSYLMNLSYLDATLQVLRALREVYQGRALPGVPASVPPPGWMWQWRARSRELCLAPEHVHHTVAHAEPICMKHVQMERDREAPPAVGGAKTTTRL